MSAAPTDPGVDEYVATTTRFPEVSAAVRDLLLGCGLDEQLKWRQPCYSHDGHNIVIFGDMKGKVTLGFFKGALLDDPDGLLADNGPNSRSVKRLFVGSVEEVDHLAAAVRAFVDQAVEVEAKGLTVGPAPELVLVAELADALAADPELRAGFASLTPGRQREYHLFVSGAKQSATRVARVQKHADRIRAGRGMRDR